MDQFDHDTAQLSNLIYIGIWIVFFVVLVAILLDANRQLSKGDKGKPKGDGKDAANESKNDTSMYF